MDAFVVAILVLGMVVMFAATLLMFAAGWQGVRPLVRIPKDRRKKAIAAASVVALAQIALLVVVIAEPLGRPTILVVFGGFVVLMLALTALQAAREIRAARRRRSDTRTTEK